MPRAVQTFGVGLLLAIGGCSSPCGGGCPDGQTCVAERCRLACTLHSECSAGEVCFQGYCEVGDLRPGQSGDGGDPDPGDAASGDGLTGDPLTGDPLTGDPLTGDFGTPTCGNDHIDGTDTCDGTDLGVFTTCEEFGWLGGGTVTCMETCALWDLSDCAESPGNCGNGMASGRQQCDPPDYNGATCESLGFSGGTLECTGDCAYVVTSCIP